jgi:hypothetical protein
LHNLKYHSFYKDLYRSLRKIRSRKKLVGLTALILALLCLSTLFLVFPPIRIQQPTALPAGCIPAYQAISKAMLFITQYASDHSRLITGISATFDNSTRDYQGVRGDKSLSYPSWQISASFFRGFTTDNPDYWEVGYIVSIWADNGEIITKSAILVM